MGVDGRDGVEVRLDAAVRGSLLDIDGLRDVRLQIQHRSIPGESELPKRASLDRLTGRRLVTTGVKPFDSEAAGRLLKLDCELPLPQLWVENRLPFRSVRFFGL